MANNFFQIKNKKKNQNFLKENGFTKLKSAIFNPESEELLLINTQNKEFWITCHDGIKDASKTINEAYNQKIQTIKTIELCLQN
jgi:hypothetical protein